MKNHLNFRILTVLTAIILSIFSHPANAQAKGSALVATTLTIQTAESIEIGSSSAVLIQLTSTKGQPIADQLIEYYVNGALERRGRTNAQGSLALKIQRDEVGTFTLNAIYKGLHSPTILASKATAKVTVVPAKIEIRITPPLPDIKFSLDKQIFSSNVDGIAQIEVKKVGTYRLEILTPKATDKDIKVEFSRWGDDTFVPYRDVEVPLGRPLDVGFEVSYQVSRTFVNLAGQPVDPSRITSVTIKGSNGTTYTFEDDLPHWLLAGRVIRLSNGLEQTKILYSVIDVTIDGSNVVSQAQQRFYAKPNDVWSLKLLLYSARFTARDALFRYPIGTGFEMEYPNGETKTYLFDSSEEHFSEGLARGIYHVTVTGVRGIAPPTPIALSRDQDVELIVLSYFDIGVMLSLGLSFAIGLLFFGRRKIFTDLAAIPNRVVFVFKKWKIRPVSFLKGFAQSSILRSHIILNKLIFQSKRLPQLFGRLANLLQVFMPKKLVPQLESGHDPRGHHDSGHNPELGSDHASHFEAVDIQAPALPQIQSIENIDQNKVSDIPWDVPLDEVNDSEQTINVLPENDVIPLPAAEVESLQLSVEDQSPTIVNSNQNDDAQVMVLENCINEASIPAQPVQPEAALICKQCGSTQIVKNGTNRRGQQQYRCRTCGTSNVFGTEPSRKRRRKKSAVNLS